MPEATILDRAEVETFLYHEAELLDAWSLRDWWQLFTEDGRYLVPPTDVPDPDPDVDLMLICDDKSRLDGRVDRLLSAYAHIENPHSRLRHLISNVRPLPSDPATPKVRASFLVTRCRSTGTTSYSGEYFYTLRRVDGELKIVEKRAVLDHLSLEDCGGVLSIIL